MKKALSFLILIISLCFVGCGCDKASISANVDNIYLYSNESFVLSDSLVSAQNIEGDIEYKIEDTAIAVIYKNTIIPQRPGTTKLFATIDNQSCEIGLTIWEGLAVTKAELDHTILPALNLFNRKTYYNKLTCNKNTEIPSVTYDSNIIYYNFQTGLIEAKNVGTTMVTIKFKNITKTFEVVVEDILYTQAMNVLDCTMTVGDFGKFQYSIVPEKSNTFKFWTDSEFLNVSVDGYYQALESGVFKVYYQYNTGRDTLSQVYSFNVVVKEKKPLFNVKVTNNQYAKTDKVLMGDDFYLVVDLTTDYEKEKLQVSENVNIVEDFKFVKNVGFVAVCRYVGEFGSQVIDVDYIINALQGTKLSYSTTVNICSIYDLTVKLKQGALVLSSNTGDYVVSVDNIATSNFLTLSLQLGDIEMLNGYEFYIIDGENRVLIEDNTINIEDFDIITVEAEFKGTVIKQFIISVNR